jgi:hypothetical protein
VNSYENLVPETRAIDRILPDSFCFDLVPNFEDIFQSLVSKLNLLLAYLVEGKLATSII